MGKRGNSGTILDSNRIYKEYKDLFKNAKNISKRLYRAYKYEFILNSIYKEDLEQELMITTFQVIKKYINKPKEDLIKLVNKSAGQKVSKIRYKCLSKLFDIKTVKTILSNTNIKKIKTNGKIKLRIRKRQEEIDKISLLMPSEFSQKQNSFSDSINKNGLFNFDEIKEMVSDKEYAILYKYYVEELNFREIGEEIKMSKQAIQSKHQCALKKIKKAMAEG